MHLIKYIQKYKTPTYFGTGLPSSGSYLNKGLQTQHAYVDIVLPSLKRLKYENSKTHKVNNHKITIL
jgi:hypothetical protein